MSFGQIIRKIRRNANMTQEQLAELLSVSPQAISRWETDAAMPDISTLPAICNLFDVSADELLEIDHARKEEKIQEIANKASGFSSRGYNEEAREILEAGLREFPNSYDLMSDLMYVSYWQSEQKDKYDQTKCDSFRKQAIELGEKILESCTKDYFRHSAIQILCFCYATLGENEKAKKLANTMPTMAVSRDMLLSSVTVGTEKYKAKQGEVFMLLHFFINWMGGSMNTKLDTGEWAYTREEIAMLRDKGFAVLNIIFENSDFGFYHVPLADCHESQARYYSEMKIIDKALYHLNKAAEHAIKFLTDYNENKTYTSLLFRGFEYGTFSTSETNNLALHLLENMKDSKYDSIRDKNSFAEVEKSLQVYAEKWKVDN